MAQLIVMDELHVQIRAPRQIPAEHLAEIRRLLSSRSFQRQVTRGIRTLFKGDAAFQHLRVNLVR